MASVQPRLSPNQVARLSVLDRLATDDEASGSSRARSLARLRESVRRDLEDLLNTRVRCRSWPAELTELERSLVNYGLPDFTSLRFSAPSDQATIRRTLERAIQEFEPRLVDIRVEKLARGDPQDRTLRYRIEATLRVRAYEGPITLVSTLGPASGGLAITCAST